MNSQTHPDSLPTDFVAFLAQRGGLSQEAAEHRLERWLGEYQASPRKRPAATNIAPAAQFDSLAL